MAEEPNAQIHRGLKGVYFDRSRVCDIDGRAGELRYRGYPIHDLAGHSSFEETCYLLFRGELPSKAELERFAAELEAARRLPVEILEMIRTVKDAHPMDVLRTAVSALAGFDPEVADSSPEAIPRWATPLPRALVQTLEKGLPQRESGCGAKAQ